MDDRNGSGKCHDCGGQDDRTLAGMRRRGQGYICESCFQKSRRRKGK